MLNASEALRYSQSRYERAFTSFNHYTINISLHYPQKVIKMSKKINVVYLD